MKRTTKRILSFLLALALTAGLLPVLALTSVAETAGTNGAKDYNTAADGDLLYVVDFSGSDKMFTKDTGVNCNNVTGFALSEDGHKVTFAEKEKAGGSYYVGFLNSYPIAGHIYTVDFYLEMTSLADRCASFLVSDGSRMALTTKQNSTNGATLNFNGSTGRDASFTVDRKVDTANNNRQYFRYVVDGTRMCIDVFALDKNDVYSLLFTYHFAYLNANFKNCLYVGMHNYDALTGEETVVLGDVSIYKGDLTKSAYQTKYDAASDGDVLYQADFRAENTSSFTWGSFRAAQGHQTISEDGRSVTLDSTKGEAQGYSAWLPNAREFSYGNFSYEFFISSSPSTGEGITNTNPRVALSVLGLSGNNTIGFSFFNTAADFCYGGNFAAADNTTLSGWGIKTAVYADADPDTSDPSKPNVKIEFDTLSKTVTCYILDADTQTFIKAKSLSVSTSMNRGSSDTNKNIVKQWNPLIYVYAYNNYTNAMLKDFKVLKGLTVSGEGSILMDLAIDGKGGTLQFVTDSTVLPAIKEKDFYTGTYTLPDGTAVSAVADLHLTAGYNRVELTTVYTPVAIPEGFVDLRGVQSGQNPTTTTTVRLVGIVNTLDFAKVGFLVAATYKDANGVIHYGNAAVDLSTACVNSSVLAGDNEAVTAAELGGKYIYALSIKNVPVGEGVQVDFTVIPYSIAEGTEAPVHGEQRVVSFINGVYVPGAPALS